MYFYSSHKKILSLYPTLERFDSRKFYGELLKVTKKTPLRIKLISENRQRTQEPNCIVQWLRYSSDDSRGDTYLLVMFHMAPQCKIENALKMFRHPMSFLMMIRRSIQSIRTVSEAEFTTSV